VLFRSAGSSVTPISVNINTAAINNAYTILTNISEFLNSFNSIYANYTTQLRNIKDIEGQQRTVASYQNRINGGADKQFYTPYLIQAQGILKQIQDRIPVTQSQINTAKIAFLQTYNQTFLSNELFNNESTISSFLRQGFEAAITV
jgi:hypothetical protein